MTMRWRTNVSLLAVTSYLTLTSALLVSYGGSKTVGNLPLHLTGPLFSVVVIVLGLSGIALYLYKDLRGHRRLRLALASFPLLVIAAGVAVSVDVRSGITAAVLIPSFFAAVFSMWNEEPSPNEPSRNLLPIFAGTVLALMGLLQLMFPREVLQPRFLPIAYVAPFIGTLLVYVQLRRPGSREADVIRWIAAVALLLSSALFVADRQAALAIMYAPFGLLLAALPFAENHFFLGMGLPSGLSEENVVVRKFELIARLAAWAVYAFSLIHLHYAPLGIQDVLFGLFVLTLIVFIVEYDFLPIKYSTYDKYLRESIINTLLLAVISHATGGLQSPYAWFFVLVVIGGSVGTNPRHVLNRLAVILGFYVLETLDTWRIGALNEVVIIDKLLLRVAVIALAGAYTYRLSSRRKEIEDSLHRRTDELATALKAAERATELANLRGAEIEAARKRDEAVMASLADAVVVVGRDRKIQFLNLAAERFAGIRWKEALGLPVAGVLPFGGPAADLEGLLVPVFRGNALPLPDETFLAVGDGQEKVYVQGAILPVGEGGDVDAAVLAFRDVTYLREVDQMKTGFLSVAAHQLRTPLSTIRWYLELLNDPEEGKLKKNQKLFTENAYQSLRKMINLVNRLLAVTRLEAGRVPVKPVPTDLAAMTEDILRGLDVKLKDRKLEVRVNIQGRPPKVPLDPTLAREVFMNLIENAIRYTPDGGAIVIDVGQEGGTLRWSVKDSGIGIPKDQQDKIFEKFFRASNAVAHASGGNGLGLYLAKFIVGTWKGDLTFTSKEGEGATFHVTVPLEGMAPKTGEISLNA